MSTRQKIAFLVALEKTIGEQKIDVVIAQDGKRLIDQVDLAQGVGL
ncbi:hypothetical protein [Facilibium subflavum]|nr:hypothetical protein [Facilibium subflavum]